MRFITKTSLNPRSSTERPHVYFGDFTAGRKFEVSRQCHGIRTRTPLLKFIIQRSRFKLSLVTESKHDKNNGMTEKPPFGVQRQMITTLSFDLVPLVTYERATIAISKAKWLKNGSQTIIQKIVDIGMDFVVIVVVTSDKLAYGKPRTLIQCWCWGTII